MKKNTVKLNENTLRKIVAESVNNVLNEIGDTPAGQWMLGRLAGRQQNRVSGSQFSKQGKIRNTTTNAKDYLPNNTYSFGKGYDLENNDWMEDEYSNGYYDHNTHEYNMSQMDMNQAYGDAMGDMIKYSADKNKLKKKVAESINKALNESNSIEDDGYNYDWDNEDCDWIARDYSVPAKPVDDNQELQPGFYVCEVGNYGNVDVLTTENLEEVQEALSASESAVFGPYTQEEAFYFAVHEVNDNEGFDFDREWVYREFNDPADIEYFYTDEKWKEIHPDAPINESKANKDMKKNTIKINENTLRKIVAESIKRTLREGYRDDEPMAARIPRRVMPSATIAQGDNNLRNPVILGANRVRSATDAAQKMNQIVQKFVYEAEEAHEPWTIQSLAREIFDKFSKINGFEYGEPHVYEFALDNIEKRLKAYVNKVYNNLWYFEEGGNGKVVAESIKKVLNEGVYDNERALGTVSPEADPNGYLDGVTDMEGCERCGYDLFIVFDRKDTHSFNGIVYVGKNDEDNEEMNNKFRHDPRYWCVSGSVVDYTSIGGEKILQLYLS